MSVSENRPLTLIREAHEFKQRLRISKAGKRLWDATLDAR
ncbi:hypothetical protein K788_0001445 (plasmid) [Paraburkholderia caribensis MBA4]|uniref:Uncharacterized protein n=1 Tax=Paraburkholderia caribensis MBA4 TaxID=1323664 RepID=A0A0P0RMS7_9BURK|nr:hypothetical protein K788_0001445 [Paraburkholderia caribensis MBA4]